jgi:hypothetical protein
MVMKTIVLLTNFTETARKANIGYLKVHSRLASKKTGNIILLNTYKRITTGRSLMVDFIEILGQYSKDDLEREIQIINRDPELQKLRVKPRSEYGDLVDVIERINKEKGIDLIVMGTKGSNLLKELLLASNTDRLIRLTKSPVLVIPESIEFKKPDKIVFATDLEECKNKMEFSKLIEIIKWFDAELLILNVYKENKPTVPFFESRMEKELKNIKHSFAYVKNPDIAEGISEFTKRNNAQLLAIIDHKANVLSQLFRYSVKYKLTQSAELPLLIIHE